MPVVAVTLEETNRSILSSVYYKIIEDVAEAVKLPKESMVILYNSQEVSLTDNKSNVSIKDTPNTPTTVTKRRIEVKVTDDYNEDSLDTTAVTKQEFFPIFCDPEISVEVAPVYIQTDVELVFKYTSPSKSEIERIRDDIRLRLSASRSIGHHVVEYNLIIPTVVEDFIADIHELKNRLKPQNLDDYFLSNATNRLHQITDMSNKENTRLAVYEKQIRIVGMYEFSSMPEKAETDTETSTHSFSFTYKFSFTAPKAMSLRYPVMLCNKVLPAKYVSFIEENKIRAAAEYKQHTNYIGNSMASLSHFEAHRQIENRVDMNVPINVPLFDDFALRQGHKGYGITMSVLVEVDETDRKTLLNLNDLDPYYIPDVILDHIRNVDRKYITAPYASFIYLGVHQEGRYFDAPILELGDDLTLRSKVPLDLLKPVRVTISIIIEASMLSKEAIGRIKSNSDVLKAFIREYISAVNTFKNEISRKGPTDMSFYYLIVETLDQAVKVDDYALIVGIIEIIVEDRYVSATLGDLLVKGYPDLLGLINRDNIITIMKPTNEIHLNTAKDLERMNDPMSIVNREQKNTTTYKDSIVEKDARYRIDRGSMKTVMTSCVVALRQQDLK